MKDLPIYDINLGDYDEGVYAISLVSTPATENDFILMSKEEKTVPQFLFSDEEKREILGAILVPDKLIYRNINGIDLYVRFSREVIRGINAKMHLTSGNKWFTIEHELGANDTVRFLESWIKETDEDKSSAFGIDAPIGSLFVKAKIESDLLWDMIKEEKLKGFSVELDAGLIKAELSKNEDPKEDVMDFKTLYTNSLVVGDNELLFNGESLIKGAVVMTVETVDKVDSLKPFNGQFKHENVEYVITDGLVSETKDIQLSVEQKLESVLTALVSLKAEVTLLKEGDEPEMNEDGTPKETVGQKIDTLLSKIEEDKLKKTQEDADAKIKADKITDSETNLEFSVEDYNAVREWSKKF